MRRAVISCWLTSQRVDASLTAAHHHDLCNLATVVGLISGQRPHHASGVVSSGVRYGGCEIRLDASIRRVHRPDALRGDIARTLPEMHNTDVFRLSRRGI